MQQEKCCDHQRSSVPCKNGPTLVPRCAHPWLRASQLAWVASARRGGGSRGATAAMGLFPQPPQDNKAYS